MDYTLVDEAISRGLIVAHEDGTLSMRPELEEEMPHVYLAFVAAQYDEYEKIVISLWSKGLVTPHGVDEEGAITWVLTDEAQEA